MFDRDIVGTLSRFLDASAMGTGGVTLVVDGMEARKVGVAPSAIQQVKINQDPYTAEFPRPGRGRIEVITKAGADKYSGSMDFTFRDAQLNARDPFADTRPPEQRRIYEGVLGGPVARRQAHLVSPDDRSARGEPAVDRLCARDRPGRCTRSCRSPTAASRPSASLTHQVRQAPHAVAAVHRRRRRARATRASAGRRSPNRARTIAGTRRRSFSARGAC